MPVCLAAFGVSILSLNSASYAFETSAKIEANAQKFVELIAQKKIESAAQLMDKHMKESLPSHVLQSLWESLEQDNGAFVSFAAARPLSKLSSYPGVVIPAKFKNDDVDFVVSVNADGEISNLVVRPHPDFIDPVYGKKDSFSEIPLDVVSGKFNLGATLCVPQGKGPFPALVLVHAAGPHDRDQTIGSIKVFRDIAWGLASKGIAVLRYEKRSRQYPKERLATVNDETVDDAVAAVNTLLHREEVDHNKVYVLGHSLGAVMIPRIAQRAPRAAGFIISSAPSQSMEDTILTQIELIEKASGIYDVSKTLESARMEVKQVKQLSEDPALLIGAPLLGLERTWWSDIKKYDPLGSAQKISQPVLVMHGENDYQVSLKDIDAWKAAVADRPNFKHKTYPKLGHVFTVAGENPGPGDYLVPQNVSDEVIADLAVWIKTAAK